MYQWLVFAHLLGLVIFVGSKHQAGHEAFLAEAMPIVESFQFDTSQ